MTLHVSETPTAWTRNRAKVEVHIALARIYSAGHFASQRPNLFCSKRNSLCALGSIGVCLPRGAVAAQVTDMFGGRGHDFDCMDEGANAAGGMLVIATSIPDAREWTQWKGRTARQDRPGQFLVLLSEEEARHAPFDALSMSVYGVDGQHLRAA
eukprot:4486195-Pleurochrysis_carterae.AAC.4